MLLAAATDGVDHVGVLLIEPVEHRRDQRGRILKISVDAGDDFAGGMGQSGEQGPLMAEVPR